MPKKTYPEAMERIFRRVFVCRVCKTKKRADSIKVKNKEIKCRKCKSTALRPKKRPI